MIQLSILIPTVPERAEQFKRLHDYVMDQAIRTLTSHEMLGKIEVLYDDSPLFMNGGPTIGAKRNALVKRAEGKYLCFLDDDESVPPDYVETLLRMCLVNQDICTFRALVKMQTFWALVDMRLAFKLNDQINPNFTVRRPPWHCCPVRSVYAKSFEFKDINNAEDFEWMERVLSCCTSEAHTDQILFQYNHGPHSEADKIPL